MKRIFDDEKEYKTQFWKNVDFLKEQTEESDNMLVDLLGITADSIRCARAKKVCSLRTMIILSKHFNKTIEEMIETDLRFSAKS